MEILDVNCFALKNNGTLLIKTETVTHDDSYRYCFYISRGSEIIYKSPYDAKSFLVYQADRLGEYKIKAFVRNADGTEKTFLTVDYVLTSKNAPLLAENEPSARISISIELVRDRLYTLSAGGDLPDQAQYAWYIYEEGNTEPVYRGAYTGSPATLYEFPEKGSYYAKVFVKRGHEKYTVKSDPVVI